MRLSDFRGDGRKFPCNKLHVEYENGSRCALQLGPAHPIMAAAHLEMLDVGAEDPPIDDYWQHWPAFAAIDPSPKLDFLQLALQPTSRDMSPQFGLSTAVPHIQPIGHSYRHGVVSPKTCCPSTPPDEGPLWLCDINTLKGLVQT